VLSVASLGNVAFRLLVIVALFASAFKGLPTSSFRA
jgi:hypothetical protein